jgi:hypothetical protein
MASHECCNHSLGLTTKARGCKVAGQEKDPGVTSHVHGSAKECERMNPRTPKWTPMLRVGVPNGFPNFQSAIARVKTHCLEEFFISVKNYWNWDVWNGLASPIRHLKHKLWPKERPGIKVAIWHPTTKSRKSTRFPCV